MPWLSVLPVVVATLFAEAPAPVEPAQPVVAPIASGQSVAPPPVLARPAPEESAGPDGAATRWYGAPMVAADVTELALLYALTRYVDDYHNAHHVDGFDAPGAHAAVEAWIVSSLVTGAVVHGLHDHGARAAGSFALRLGAMLISALAAISQVCDAEGNPSCGHPSVFVKAAFYGTPLAAMAIDDVFLAREPVPAAPAKTSWTPTLRIQSGLALLGVGASF